MAHEGQVILLNGASSSGKTTLAKHLQQTLSELYWHWSFDHLRDQSILPMDRIRCADFSWAEHREKVFSGFHNSIRAFARAGNNLIVEHIIENQNWHRSLQIELADVDVLFVGVHCSLAVLEDRERTRGDRNIGEARKDFETIHRFVQYDVEVNGEQDVQYNVSQILDYLRLPKTKSRFFETGHHE